MTPLLLKKCISIIRLESTPTKWTATPEDYISSEFHHFYNALPPPETKEIMDFLTYLHCISLDITIKEHIKAVNIDAPTLLQKFRALSITLSDTTIQDIPKRWEQLIQIRDRVSILRPEKY
jgi:hypothetical protein